MPPVYVTGLGVACGLGYTPEALWQALLLGQSSIQCLNMDAAYRSRLAGLVDEAQLQLPSHPTLKHYSEPYVRYAVHAAQQAIVEAKLQQRGIDPHRIGVIISTGIGGIQTIEQQHASLLARGPSRISPFFVPNAIANAASGLVSLIYGLGGLNGSFSSACSSSTQALGLALRLIQSGDIDACVVGGAEHASTACGLAGFAAQRALSTRHEAPKEACRPWDRDRDGFVLADGAAVLVLEKASAHMPEPYAALLDVGWSSDAFHVVQPDPEGKAAKRAMQQAMKTLTHYEHVDYINAHATGTPLGDRVELDLVRALWPDHRELHMSSTKSMHGHLLGAAGAIEALITAMAVKYAVVPPTINCPHPEAQDICLTHQGAESKKLRYALSNSFGFGGTNATLLFSHV